MLAEIHRVLSPEGRLVIETMHRDWLARHFQENRWMRVGEGRLMLEQVSFDPTSGLAQTTQTLVDPGGERDSRTWSLRVYSATEPRGDAGPGRLRRGRTAPAISKPARPPPTRGS